VSDSTVAANTSAMLQEMRKSKTIAIVALAVARSHLGLNVAWHYL
jgi:hypothetical protein